MKCHLKLQELDQAYEVLGAIARNSQELKIKIDYEMVSVIRRVVEFSIRKNKPKVENSSKENINLITQNLDVLDKISSATKLNP